MASTSGLANTTTITRDEMILSALQELRQVPGNYSTADLNPNDVSACARRMNMVLKRWETKGLLLWCYDRAQLPLVQNQYRYRLGPPDGDFPDYRPLRVMEGSTIRDTCSDNPNDITLVIWSRLEYMQTSNKSALGTPNSIYHDEQMRDGITSYDPSYGQSILYVYPAPATSTYTLFLNVQRPIQDVTTADQTFDLPLEWMETLMVDLAASCADMYEIPEDRIKRKKAEARDLLEQLADYDTQEWATTYFQPSYQTGQSHR